MPTTTNTISDLREHLFETLAALKNPEKPMDLDRAKTIAEVAKVIVESAKAEVSFLATTGALNSTGFIPNPQAVPVPGERRLTAAK